MSTPSTLPQRLAALRQAMQQQHIDACLIPSGECTPGPGFSSYGQYFTPPRPSYGEGDIPYGGSYLVRAAPVPEASTKVLAVVGLLGVFIARRRKA